MTTERLTLTIREVAQLLGISKNTCYELARRGELPVPVLRLGRRLVVPRAAMLHALGIVAKGGTDDLTK